jgi:hypothetical protein
VTKHITLQDFLTDEEIEYAAKLYERREATGFAQVVCEQIIRPNMERINKALGQANDPMYLAYAIEYVMNEAEKQRKVQ